MKLFAVRDKKAQYFLKPFLLVTRAKPLALLLMPATILRRRWRIILKIMTCI